MPAISSNQVRGYRRLVINTVNADNLVFQNDLPRGPAIESAVLNLVGSIQVTTAYTAVLLQAPVQLIKRVDWVINGSLMLDSASGYMLQANWMRHNLTPLTPPSGFTAATYPIALVMFMDRAMTDGVRPKDSELKTDVGMSSNQLRITMGAISDMFVGAGVGNYSPGLTLQISAIDYQEARNSAGQTPTPAFYLQRYQIDLPCPTTTQNLQQKLSTGNRLRAILFRPNIAGGIQTYGNVSIAVMNNIILNRAGDQRANFQYTALQTMNAGQFPVAFNTNPQYTGFVVLDLAANGALGGIRYSEFWPIPSTADTFLTLDVNGGATNSISMMTLMGVDIVQPS